MIPVATPEQMHAADAAAVAAAGDAGVFIRRAGHAVAETARTMMHGTYGRRVTVIAGKGNNGNDGRVAAAVLASWGASVTVTDAADAHGLFVDPRTVSCPCRFASGQQSPTRGG
ncbi:MAG: NAD(P)H-hydrate epimerase [Actinomycetota bacterium]